MINPRAKHIHKIVVTNYLKDRQKKAQGLRVTFWKIHFKLRARQMLMAENKLKYPFTLYPVIMCLINCNIALVLIWISVMI